MKLGKVTSGGGGEEKRWYDDACGTALALEFVGERWSLLVMRELMFGPRRFGELRANLPGISANILTQRLAGLEGAGIARRRTLPSPASVQVYELTPWGLEVEPVLQTMGRWATRSPRHDPTLFLSPASAMLSLRTMLDAKRAKDQRMTLAFRFPTDAFLAELADGALAIRRGEGEADVTISAEVSTLIALVYLKRPPAEAEADGSLAFAGDRAAWARFTDLFALLAKVE